MNTVTHIPARNGNKLTLHSSKIAVAVVNGTSHSGHRPEKRTAHGLLARSSGQSRHVKIRSTNYIGRETRVSPTGNAGRTQYHPANGNGVHMHMTKTHPAPEFRAMGEYENKELCAVKFRSDNEADRALVLIGKSPGLKRMPYLFADGITFIVPKEAVLPLKDLKLRFKVSDVAEMDDLDPEERAEIRRYQSL